MTGHSSTLEKAKRALEDLGGEATQEEIARKSHELYPQGRLVEGQVGYLFRRDDDVELVETQPKTWRLNGHDDRQDDDEPVVDELEEPSDRADLDDIDRHDDEENGHNSHARPSFFDDIVEVLLAYTYQTSDELAERLDLTPNAAGSRCSRDPRIAKARGHWRIRRPQDVDDAWDVSDWPRVADKGADANRLEHDWPCPFKGCTFTTDWVPAIQAHANSACTEEQKRALEDDVDEDLDEDEPPAPSPRLESSPRKDGDPHRNPPSMTEDAQHGDEDLETAPDDRRALERLRSELIRTLRPSLDVDDELEHLASLALNGILDERPVEDVVAEYLNQTQILEDLQIKLEVTTS